MKMMQQQKQQDVCWNYVVVIWRQQPYDIPAVVLVEPVAVFVIGATMSLQKQAKMVRKMQQYNALNKDCHLLLLHWCSCC